MQLLWLWSKRLVHPQVPHQDKSRIHNHCSLWINHILHLILTKNLWDSLLQKDWEWRMVLNGPLLLCILGNNNINHNNWLRWYYSIYSYWIICDFIPSYLGSLPPVTSLRHHGDCFCTKWEAADGPETHPVDQKSSNCNILWPQILPGKKVVQQIQI